VEGLTDATHEDIERFREAWVGEAQVAVADPKELDGILGEYWWQGVRLDYDRSASAKRIKGERDLLLSSG